MGGICNTSECFSLPLTNYQWKWQRTMNLTPSDTTKKIPCRQICGACHRVSPIDFAVPKEIWVEAVHPYYQNDHICIYCFAAWADDKLLAWDKEIEMLPMSLQTHIKEVRGQRNFFAELEEGKLRAQIAELQKENAEMKDYIGEEQSHS